jgi:hypothetical protein
MRDKGQCKELLRLMTRLLEAAAEVDLYAPKRIGRRWRRAEAALADARNAERSARLDLREHITRHGCEPAKR